MLRNINRQEVPLSLKIRTLQHSSSELESAVTKQEPIFAANNL